MPHWSLTIPAVRAGKSFNYFTQTHLLLIYYSSMSVHRTSMFNSFQCILQRLEEREWFWEAGEGIQPHVGDLGRKSGILPPMTVYPRNNPVTENLIFTYLLGILVNRSSCPYSFPQKEGNTSPQHTVVDLSNLHWLKVQPLCFKVKM